MKSQFRITVFTPTYNRAHLINRLYESLKRQSFIDFEWLVIDDGSSDHTQELFEEWSQERVLTIRYYRQENGGKCRAINRALDLAHGDVFFTVDSDDYLTDDALEKLNSWIESLPEGANYCGVAGNLGTTETETSNTLFEGEYYDGTLLDRYHTIDGERAIAIFTEIHRKYKYPVIDGEKFMTEAVTWNRMAHDGYRMRFYNDIIWVYEYQEDGLTHAGNKLFLNNPAGYALWMREKAEFEGDSLFQKFKLVYALTIELYPLYGARKTAGYLKTATPIILFCAGLHRIKQLWSRK